MRAFPSPFPSPSPAPIPTPTCSWGKRCSDSTFQNRRPLATLTGAHPAHVPGPPAASKRWAGSGLSEALYLADALRHKAVS